MFNPNLVNRINAPKIDHEFNKLIIISNNKEVISHSDDNRNQKYIKKLRS